MGQHKNRLTPHISGGPNLPWDEETPRLWTPDERRDEQKKLLRSLIIESAKRAAKTEWEMGRLGWNLHPRGDNYEKTLREMIRLRDERVGPLER